MQYLDSIIHRKSEKLLGLKTSKNFFKQYRILYRWVSFNTFRNLPYISRMCKNESLILVSNLFKRYRAIRSLRFCLMLNHLFINEFFFILHHPYSTVYSALTLVRLVIALLVQVSLFVD